MVVFEFLVYNTISVVSVWQRSFIIIIIILFPGVRFHFVLQHFIYCRLRFWHLLSTSLQTAMCWQDEVVDLCSKELM